MANDWRDVSTGSGVRRRIRFHEVENLIEEEITQPNMGAILDQNHRELNAHNAKAVSLRPGEVSVKVATVPFWLLEHWRNKLGINYFDPNDRVKIVAMLNSNEYSKLRTAHGIVPTGQQAEW